MVSVGLARESSAVAAKELAYDYQVERLTEYGCRWVFGDRLSGTRDDRIGLKQALEKIESGEANELVVTHLTRLGRSVMTINRVVQLLKKHKAALTVLGGAIDTSTPEGRAFLNSQAVWGEYEAELGAERQRIGWENSLKKGRPRAPVFGYAIADGKYNPDLEDRGGYCNWDLAQELIAKFFELRSLNGVAKWVAAEWGRVRSLPRHLSPPSSGRGVKIWLLNPALQGHVWFKNGLVRHLDQHEPLLSADQAADIRSIIETRFAGGDRTNHRRHAYTGLVFCARCEGRAAKHTVMMRGAMQRRRNPLPKEEEKTLFYYRCGQARYGLCGNTKRVRYEAIDIAVVEAIARQSNAIAQWLTQRSETPPSEDPEIKSLKLQIERLLPVAEIDPRIKETIADLELAIANLQHKAIAPSPERLKDSAIALEVLKNQNFWAEYNAIEKHDILRGIIKRILIEEGQIVEVQFQAKFSPEF